MTFFLSFPLTGFDILITHLPLRCSGVSAFLCEHFALPHVSLASLFSPPSRCLCLSPLSRSHTPNTHNKNTTSLLISTRLVMSCLARGMRRSPQQCSPACHIHTNIQREEPAVTKQHAPKYSWESWKGYKANMCGEHQTLNVGSGVRKVATLIFVESPSVKWLWLFLFHLCLLQSSLIKTHRMHTKRPDWTRSPSRTRDYRMSVRFCRH